MGVLISKSRRLLPGIVVMFVLLSLVMCSDKERILAGISDGNELQTGDVVPFKLDQNFPNPFSGTTTIHFELAEPLHLTLRVYTMNWECEATLLDKDYDAGVYMVRYHADKRHSGDYFYVLKGGGYSLVRRMQLYK